MRKQPYISHINPPKCSDAEVGDIFIAPDMFGSGLVFAECEGHGCWHCMGLREFAAKHHPYKPGDVLWVRECWARDPSKMSDGAQSNRYAYRADGMHGCMGYDGEGNLRLYHHGWVCGFADTSKHGQWVGLGQFGGKWRPSIHMPREACRLRLEVLRVWVERVQDISEADAKAEGVEYISVADVPRQSCWTCRQDFAQLWNSLYGTWDANPWVWACEFRRVD
jgi:hypothetical protein